MTPMTFEQRVATIAGMGFTPRQARFLTLVALHSGYCLRRQYATFTGTECGKNAGEFLERLVARRVACRITFRRDRGHIYHLFARPLYAALQQDDNRNRRYAGPALIARKLMLLDFVLTQPERDWYVTETEKVALFTQTLGVPIHALPHRTYEAMRRLAGPTVRYCVQKLPIFLTSDPARVHFVCLVTDPHARDIGLFVREHYPLLTHLAAYTLVVVRPAHIANDPDCTAAWETAVRAMITAPRALDDATLLWYFDARRRIEHGQLRTLSIADIDRYRACRKRAGGTLDALYSQWLEYQGPSIETLDQIVSRARQAGAGQVVIATLPYRYEQFGTMPGVA
jgi:hypothetical protein